MMLNIVESNTITYEERVMWNIATQKLRGLSRYARRQEKVHGNYVAAKKIKQQLIQLQELSSDACLREKWGSCASCPIAILALTIYRHGQVQDFEEGDHRRQYFSRGIRMQEVMELVSPLCHAMFKAEEPLASIDYLRNNDASHTFGSDRRHERWTGEDDYCQQKTIY